MAITIKIGSGAPQKIEPKEIVNLKVAKSLNDDVMVFVHADIYIVVQPKTQKVIAYA
jgi:hypothetical protein